MESNRTLTLVMSPGEWLEVLAPDVVEAIAVVREALRYLRGTRYAKSSDAEPRREPSTP